MNTYILAWNPTRWPWDEFEQDVARSQSGEIVQGPWSSGNNRSIQPGDRVFLLRQAVDRGLIGSGFALSAVFQAAHWNPERDDDANYADVRFDTLLPISDVLPVTRLHETVPDVPWDRLQASGISVPAGAASQLESLWQNHLARMHRREVPFVVGGQYTRKDIYRILGVLPDHQGGDWDTGYHRHGDDWFIFASVGTTGRTGHEYGNHWEGDELVWRGRTGSKLEHQSTKSLLQPAGKVFLFTRAENRSPFAFQGCATPAEALDTVPVTIRWRFTDGGRSAAAPWEVPQPERFLEGTTRTVTVNAYERSREARDACVGHYGTRCTVCGFDFGETYGTIGEGFIHVHHLRDLASIGQEYEVDPIADLRPVCPNCHAMLHTRTPALTVEELQAVMSRNEPDGRLAEE